MGSLLSSSQLRETLKADYKPRQTNKEAVEKRKHNIQSFNKINRTGLEYNKLEKRILLYETMNQENVFIQLPGKESAENPSMPLDFRPKIQLQNGEFASDLSFGAIWDILDEIGKKLNSYLSYIAAIFFKLGYMHDYRHIKDDFKSFEVEIVDGNEIAENEVQKVNLDWYCLNIPEDVWYTLNDVIGMIDLGNGQTVSFEGFIKLVDLLFQNEDCKYYYKNVIIKGDSNYKYANGRNNSSGANLLILNYLQGNVKMSKLLDAFQKSRGVPQIKKGDYSTVTDKMVINIENESRD